MILQTLSVNQNATTITNDTTTNATMYPVWVTASSGNLPLKVSNSSLTFNPSTAALVTSGYFGTLNPNLGTTPLDTSGTWLANNTAAAVGAQQVSPSTTWEGQGWKTTATAASQSVKFQAYVLPVQGSTAPSGTWNLQAAIAGGAYSNTLTVSSAGLLTSANGVVAGGALSSSSSPNNSNFYVVGPASAVTQAGAQYQLGAATATFIRTGFYGNSSTSLAANASYSSVNIGAALITTPATGTNAMIANLAVKPMGTITQGAASLTNTASLYIDGAASATVTGGNYSLYSAAGLNFFGGAIVANGTIQVGGTTSSFPMIKNQSAAIRFRLADDSADTSIIASDVTATRVLVGAGSRILSPTDGIIELTDSTQTTFTRLQFGGTTSSFPCLKRNSAAIECKLADDSAYATFGAGNIAVNGQIQFPGSARITSPTTNNLLFLDAAATSIGLVMFGGTTSSFPAIKRNATALNFRLADDSADCALTASAITLSGLTASSAVATDGSKNLVSVTNTGTGNNVLSASPTLTGTTIAANVSLSGALSSSAASNVSAQINTSGQTGFSVANGANTAITAATNAYNITIVNTSSGDMAVYIASAGGCALVSSTGSSWVAPTTTPAAGKASIQFNGATANNVYNNTGGTVTFKVLVAQIN